MRTTAESEPSIAAYYPVISQQQYQAPQYAPSYEGQQIASFYSGSGGYAGIQTTSGPQQVQGQMPYSQLYSESRDGSYAGMLPVSSYSLGAVQQPQQPLLSAPYGSGNTMTLVGEHLFEPEVSSTYSTPPTTYSDSEAWTYESGQDMLSPNTMIRAGSSNSGNSSSRGNSTRSGAAGGSEAIYECPVEGCGKSFNRSYNFRAHMETHDANRVYPFDCPLEGCDKRFRRKTDLQRHHQSVHMKQRDHQCEFCGRYFSRKDTLRRHRDDGCSRRNETTFEIAPAGPQ